MSESDAILLRRWTASRDADAFAEIVARYSGMVYGTCQRLLHNAADAEDVAQECFVSLMEKSGAVRKSLAGWLHAKAVSRSLDRLRSAKRRETREQVYAAQRDTQVEISTDDLMTHIDEAIAKLPEELQSPVILRFLKGETHAGIAAALGIAKSTVRYRVSKGIEKVRASLKRRGIAIPQARMSLVLAGGELAGQAPESLTASLGKLAMAGTGRATMAAGSAGGLLVMKKLVLFVVCLILVLVSANAYRRIVAGNTSRENLPALSHMESTLAETAQGLGTPLKHAEGLDAEAPEPVENGAKTTQANVEGRFASDMTPESSEAKEEPRSPINSASVSGFVMDTDAFPVPNALVVLVMGSYTNRSTLEHIHTAHSDETGRYTVAYTAAFEHRSAAVITVQAAGFNYATKKLVVDPKEDMDNVVFTLRGGATLDARLLTQDGVPIAGAFMGRRGFVGQHNHGNGDYDSVARTDKDGRFTLGFMEEGEAVITMTSTTHDNTAFIDVPVGLDEIVELRLPEAASLSGRITHPDGSPAPGLILRSEGHFTRTGVASDGYARTDEDGHYRFASLPPDLSYRVCIRTEDEAPLSPTVDLGLFAPGEDRQWDHSLALASTVSVTVVGKESGKPLSGMRIVHRRMEESDSAEWVEAGWLDASGRRSFDLFEPGSYLILAEYDRSARSEPTELYSQELEVRGGEDYALDFRLPDQFSLSVRVVDANSYPIERAEVWHVKGFSYRASSHFRKKHTDSGGRYTGQAFQAGLGGWFEISKEGYLPATTTRIVGEPGVDYEEETVILYASAGIEGVLVDARGFALADTPFTCSVDSHRLSHRGTTDADGIFIIPKGIPAATCEFSFTIMTEDGQSFTGAAGPAECEAGEYADVGQVAMRIEANEEPGAAQ